MSHSLKRKFLAGILAGAMMLITALPAAAQAQLAFSFVNNSGWVLSGLYVDASSSQTWGENILSRPMETVGDTIDITFSGYGETCVFDIAAENVQRPAITKTLPRSRNCFRFFILSTMNSCPRV